MAKRRRKTIRRWPIRLHVFTDSGDRDHGERICTCGSVEVASVHRIREVSDEERLLDARRVGEKP